MPISIKPPSRKTLNEIETRFALQQDDWNDYSFRTLYHLYYRSSRSGSIVTYIGGVKILKMGQKPGPLLINKPFNKLSKNWISVGTSLDYYQRLNELPTKYRDQIMNSLNDAVSHPELVPIFMKEEGWQKSVFRNNNDWRSFLKDAQALYNNNFTSLADLKESFSFIPAGADTPINFDFSSPDPDTYFGPYRRVGPRKRRTLLPDRIFVLVGSNGSGKSTLLSRLAHIAFASPLERATKELQALGKIDPPSIGFMRVITISYSAFDSFVVPGLDAKELSQMTRDLESGEGRFVFCGLRDLVAEARADIEADANIESSGSDDEQPVERRTTTRLKPVEKLADEFVALLKRIRQEDRVKLLEAALEPLLSDPSFAELKNQIEKLKISSASARSLFLGWSTGHKIALHVVTSLVANTLPRTIVLFDEPEAHLHPPLMAALMHAVRIVLTEMNALCVVATHSPVLLQETLSRHVRRVRRTGKLLEITKPELETFGENVGILTYNTFGLTASSTDFHKVLDLLVSGCDTPEEVDELFQPGLSAQARAYVLTQFSRKK